MKPITQKKKNRREKKMSIKKRKCSKFKSGYSYEVQLYYPGENGETKSYSKRGFRTKKEALEHENLKKMELLQKGTIEKEKEQKTLNEVYEEFLEIGSIEYQHNTILNTKHGYSYFKNELGNMKIKKINYQVLQKFFNARINEGIETNKRIKKALNRIFEYALKCNYIDINYVKLVKVKGKENSRENKNDILTFSQLSSLMDILHEKNSFEYESYSVAISIGFYTGLRISEVLALEKSDIDFKNNTINVCKKLEYNGLKKEEIRVSNEMKSVTSKQIIDLEKDLKNILLEWFEMNPYNLIVCDKEGYYLVPRIFQTKVNQLIKSKGLDFHFHFHMLRHTFASMLYNNGVNIKEIQHLMRHADIKTTLGQYTHLQGVNTLTTLNETFDKIKHSSIEWGENGALLN